MAFKIFDDVNAELEMEKASAIASAPSAVVVFCMIARVHHAFSNLFLLFVVLDFGCGRRGLSDFSFQHPLYYRPHRIFYFSVSLKPRNTLPTTRVLQ